MDAFPRREIPVGTFERLVETLAREVYDAGVDPQAWLFDVCCENLPASRVNLLRPAQPGLCFDPWLYEHGSPWIVPYLNP